jgi:hypothetical protein
MKSEWSLQFRQEISILSLINSNHTTPSSFPKIRFNIYTPTYV